MTNLIGQVFDRLTVLHKEGMKNKHTAYKCKCSCGNETIVASDKLKSGAIRSCGCLRNETSRKLIGYNRELNRDDTTGGLKLLYAQYKQAAQYNSREFMLTLEQVKLITSKACTYCGRPPKQIKKGRRTFGEYTYNGIDRVDNAKGYTIDNIVPCCKLCNRAKREMSIEEFEQWIKDLVEYRTSK